MRSVRVILVSRQTIPAEPSQTRVMQIDQVFKQYVREAVAECLETYSHVTPGIQAEATNKLDRILRSKTG